MGQTVFLDADCIEMLKDAMKDLEKEKIYQTTWSNSFRKFATDHGEKMRIKKKPGH